MSNSRLNAAEKKHRLVVVARDVIKQLKLMRFHAETGSYVYLQDNHYGLDDLAPKEFQDKLRVSKCDVCVIGAVFVSYVDKYDGFSGSTMGGPDHAITRVLGTKTLRAMEAVFEGFPKRGLLGSKLYKKLWDHVSRDADEDSRFTPEQRMLAIMRNVIRNKGEFKP